MNEISDEGVYYITVTPNDINPLTAGLERLVKNRPCGSIPPKTFALVPFTIKFRSIKPTTMDRSEKFHKLLRIKIDMILDKAIDKVLTTIKDAEKWTNIIVDGKLQNHDFNLFIKFDYGEVASGIWEILSSNLISETSSWKTKYGYEVDVLRETLDIMLLFSTAGEQCLMKINQRVQDENPKISSRQWSIGLSFKRQYLWKRTWWDIIKRIAD